MKARTFSLVAGLSLTTAAAIAAYGSALAGEPAAKPSGEASPAASASAGGWLPPTTSSKKPDDAEWAGAQPLELPRKRCRELVASDQGNTECSSACSAKVLREWVKVSCTRAKATEVLMGVRVLSGPHDDVTLVDPPEPAGGDKGQRGFSLVFPVRPGDRRSFEVAAMLPLAWKAWTVEEALELVVSAMWLPNAARPVVTVY